MCGIVGFANITDNISHFQDTLINMTNSLSSKGPYEDGFYTNTHICMSHKRLLEINPNDIEQPILFKDGERKIVLTYNGRIYNSLEIKKDLTNLGYSFSSNSDTEILFKAYLEYGYDILNKLNGVFSFAIWDDFKQELFLARDHFGIKPLFYTLNNNNFIFSSEIKALFEFPMVEPILDKTSISELIGIGPAHTPGMTVFKNIYELKPAHFAIFNSSGLHIERYWKLETFEHHDDLEKTSDTLKNLLEESINEQLVSDIPLCTFLSGGLDSSIITLYAKNYYEKHNLGDLNTFSVDYIDNDKNFVKTDFQPNSDSYYINIMKDKLNTSHHTIMLDTPELAKFLEDAMIARDMPGMADVDSSLLLFCKNVKKEATVSLTGECADEIFGGYPWFFREDALSSNTFPWSIAISERQHLLNLDINNKINLKEYIDFRYHESLSEVETLSSDSFETAQKRKISHLTLNWFMQTLLERSDRMAMYNGFEIRVPFCNPKIAQYAWNIPWELKALNGREKGLLRYCMKDILPSEIVNRKKSPYPKTWNPTYLATVKGMLSNIMNDKNAPINNLLNREYILDILNTDGKAFSRPWFGQLMTGPQLMAYLCQVNMWLERYQPKIEI